MENANFKILDYLVPNCLPVFFFSCSECINYAVIFGSKRKRTYKSKQPYLDDGDLNGWYRFQGQAGTKMATSCVPFKRCDGQRPGWLKGGISNSFPFLQCDEHLFFSVPGVRNH